MEQNGLFRLVSFLGLVFLGMPESKFIYLHNYKNVLSSQVPNPFLNLFLLALV